jgi:hypothetical protein
MCFEISIENVGLTSQNAELVQKKSIRACHQVAFFFKVLYLFVAHFYWIKFSIKYPLVWAIG